MKKSIIALLLTFCFLVTGCKPNSNEPANGKALHDTDEYKQVLNAETASFRTTAKELQGCTSSDKGFYEVRFNDDGSKTIWFTDFASSQKVVLCSQPNCKHNNESCTAWVDSAKGEIMLAAVNNKLAVVYTNYYHLESASKPYIEIWDASGTNRQKLCEFEPNMDISSDILTNDKYFIMKINCTEEKNGAVVVTSSIVALNLETGKTTTLYSIEHENTAIGQSGELWLNIIGATDTSIIFFTRFQGEFTASASDLENTNSSKSKAMIFTYYEIPINGGETRKIYEHNSVEASVGVCKSGFYIIESKDNVESIYRINFKTLEKELFVPDFSKNVGISVLPDTIFTSYQLIAQVNDKVVFKAFASEEFVTNENWDSIERTYKTFAVDINTAEISEITLSVHHNAKTEPIYVISQFDDSIFVLAKIDEVISVTNPSVTYYYATILKADYLNSIPNYKFIKLI